jgi:RNA polymerase sigma-70 factor, ECF subfamily
MQNQTDEQLIAAYLKGEEQALEILVQRYLSPLYNFAFKYVHTETAAEDVAQEAMLKIWKNLKKFDGNYKFKTWAYTITKNTALDYLKKKGLVALAEPLDGSDNGVAELLISRQPLPEEILEKIDDAALVKTALAKLPEKYRLVISLYYGHELNFREIAQFLKQPINTIKTRHRRAVLSLKKILIDK